MWMVLKGFFRKEDGLEMLEIAVLTALLVMTATLTLISLSAAIDSGYQDVLARLGLG